MKLLNALAMSGALLLTAALPAAAQSISPQASGPPRQLAAEGEFGAKKDEYVQKSKSEVAEWRRKVDELKAKSQTKGREASSASERHLHEAWAKTEAESHKLEGASADGWENAKSSFEKASQNLKDAWHKLQPEAE